MSVAKDRKYENHIKTIAGRKLSNQKKIRLRGKHPSERTLLVLEMKMEPDMKKGEAIWPPNENFFMNCENFLLAATIFLLYVYQFTH